mgnify:CR=1 FL=1
MFSVFFTDREVRDFDDAGSQDTAAHAAFFQSMLESGIHLPPSAFEAWFLSYAHTDDILDRIVTALPTAARAAAATGATADS